MTIPQGGLRERLIYDSVYTMLSDALTALGWFTSQPTRADILLPHGPVDINESITYNTIAIVDLGEPAEEWELGSSLAQYRWAYNFDVFAQNDSLSRHLAGDIRAILEGKLAAASRTTPTVNILDTTVAEPYPTLFVAEFEGVSIERPQDSAKPWLAHWRTVVADLVYYA